MDNQTERINESKLRSFEVSGGFTVPMGYFNQSKQHILNKVGMLKEQHLMGVPQNYFEKSRASILQKTIGNTPKPLHVVWYKKYLKTYTAAASVLLIASVLLWFVKPNKINSTHQLSDEEIMEYLNQSDLKDVPAAEMVSYTQFETSAAEAEQYILNHIETDLITDEL